MRWACRWCTPTRRCGGCSAWGCYKLDSGWLRILEPHALETLGDYFERPMQPLPLI